MPFATPSTAAHVPRHLFRWLTLLLVCVLLGGALLTWLTVWRTGEEMRESLLAQARRVTYGLHLRRIRALTGTNADLASPSYQRVKAQLTLIRHAYDQCRFIYLMGCTSNRPAADATVFFYVDSEDPSSEDYSPPGQIYPDATPELRAAFTTGVPFVEGPLTDAWGTWVSALVPVTNPRTHAVIALLGMDVDARDWRRRLWRAAWPPLLLTAGLMTMLVLGTSLLDWRRRHAATCAPWLWRLEAGVVVVFGAILTCYATWVAHNEEMHARRRVFMQLAESETDQIIDSICDVREFELGALARFFEASEVVTYDEFQHYAGILEDDPAVFSWQWLPAVPAAEKRRVEAQLRALGAPATSLWQLGAHGAPEPVHDRAVYYPVMYVMPRAGNEWSLGFDAGSEPIRRAAMVEAERAGLGTGTELIRLGVGAGPPQGMVVFYPVRAVGASRRLRGYVAAVVRFDALPQLMLDASVRVELLLLRDGASAAAERTIHTAADVHDPTLALTRPVPAFGKVLWICAHPGEMFLRRHAARAGVATALIGMTLTLALATLVGVPLRRRYELEQLVAARTKDLSNSERHYRNLFTSSRDGIVEVDNQRRIVNANEAYCAMLGYTLEELRALPNFDAITPPHWHAWERDEIWLRRLAQQYYSGIYEKEYVRRDGTVFPVEVQAFVVGDHADATYYAWATVRAITERKRVEAERERLLQDAEHARCMLMRALTEEQRAAAENARLAAAMQQATDAVVITDVRGIIQYVNPAFERTSGYTRAEVMGHTSRLLKSGQHPDAFYQQLWATNSAALNVHMTLTMSTSSAGSVVLDTLAVYQETTNAAAPPATVTASAGTYTDRVRVTWSASTGVDGYQVFRSTVSNSAGATVLSPALTVWSYDDTSAAPGATYYYWVKASNAFGWSGFSAGAPGYAALPNPGLLNGSFEIESTTPNKPADWIWNSAGAGNIWLSQNYAHSGVRSVMFPGYNEWNTLVQTYANAWLGGATITASVWGLTPGFTTSNSGGVLLLRDTDQPAVSYGSTQFVTRASPTGQWVKATIITNLPAQVDSIDFVLQLQGGAAGLVYFDDAELNGPIPEPALLWLDGLVIPGLAFVFWKHRSR
jgi:PAS domain S-box-containing protein